MSFKHSEVKKKSGFFIKLLILGLFIYLINKRINFNFSIVKSIDLNYLNFFIGLFFTSIAMIFSSQRWREILKLTLIKVSIKEAIIYGNQKRYFDEFNKDGLKYSNSAGKVSFLAQAPRYTLEFLAFSVILFFIVFLVYFVIAEYSEITITLAIILIFFILQILLMIGAADIKRFKNKLINFSIFQISFYLILVFYVNNHIQDLWVAKRINSIIELNKKNYDKIYNYGFGEPSLVFLTSHKSKNSY